MTDLIDDQLLGQLMRGGRDLLPPEAVDRLATTGLWRYRLARAVLAAPAAGGRLSSGFAAVPRPGRERLLESVRDLCPAYGLALLAVPAAELAGTCAEAGIHLNALNAEALAAAVHLGARILVTTEYPALEAAAPRFGVEMRRIGTS